MSTIYFESSKYFKIFIEADFTLLTRSPIKIRKRRGPNTLPWGTPECNGALCDKVCPIHTFCVLFVRKFKIHLNMFPCIPLLLNLFSRIE